MSSTMYYQPVRKTNHVSNELMNALHKKFGTKHILNHHNLDYLHGLADAGMKDADKIINMIEKHDEVNIWTEH